MKVIKLLRFLIRCLDVYKKRPELVKNVISSDNPDEEFNKFYSSFENEVIELMKLECNKKINKQHILIERQKAEINALNELLSQ